MSEQTIFNPAAGATVINPGNAATVVNRSLDGRFAPINEGKLLLGRYAVKEPLSLASGEADLYICESGGDDFVAKVYRRSCAVKEEIIATLRSVESPWVAPVIDAGVEGDSTVIILPYYKNGSLSGRTFSLEQLKGTIIPCINGALDALHQAGIIHKDLKPSNIMMLDNNDGVALIDFGISSIMDDGSTVLLTQTGMTPEYSAPETFRGLYLEESDYYSFGITLYELFCGKTPYKDLAAEDIVRFMAIQQIPTPEGMPQELKDLISGLTYHDITNRNDPSNPNRRWTHEEVALWCEGNAQPVPGTAAAAFAGFPLPYSFLGQKYNNMPDLVDALASNWDEGVKQLCRGLLSGFFKNVDPEVAGFFMDAEEEARHTYTNNDLVFWKTLYKVSPKTDRFYWKSVSCESLPAFGTEVLQKLWAHDGSDLKLWDEILDKKVLSQYCALRPSKRGPSLEAISAIETQHELGSKKPRERLINYYTLGYLLSGHKTLKVNGKQFESVNELSRHMSGLIEQSFELFERFAQGLIGTDSVLDAQFEAWLIALGHRSELATWKKGLKR